MVGNDITYSEWTDSLTKLHQNSFGIVVKVSENCIKTHKLSYEINDFILIWSALIQGISISVVNERFPDFARKLFPDEPFDNNDIEIITKRLLATLVPIR